MELKEHFSDINIEQILGDENSQANALANLGSTLQVTESKNIPIIYLKWLVVWKQEHEIVYELSIETTWMTPIFDYIQNDSLPKNKDVTRKIKAIST